MINENFKRRTKQEDLETYGGSIIATIIALAPIVISGITAIANVVKMFSSNSGEVKTKDQSVKWDNNQKTTETRVLYMYY
ncbi:hypothetical protein [Mycoplasmopsis iners]|uniref:hypothetical protein n=1 Tax=Mycoplasmopsis iners TaxID=76630 RepID=UPI0004969D6F|nr:hypothetical protein [Mycoplasmopsis iners]